MTTDSRHPHPARRTRTGDASPSPETTSGVALPGTASARIAERLRADIISGDLYPGQRIRQEDLADRFGASRLPVREALRILESQGLVVLRANSGAWVAEMNMAECEATYKIRERLEPLALAESIPHLTAAQLDRLDRLQTQIEQDDDLDRFLALDRELHLSTYAGNPFAELHDIIERLWNTTQPYRRAYVRLDGAPRRWVVNVEHRLLLDAIRRGDSEDAERVLHGHIRRTRISLQGHDELFAPAAPLL